MYKRRFPFNEPKVSKIWKQQQMVQKFPRKIPETVEFPKCEQLSQKFKKFREQSWMERKKFPKIWVYLARFPSLWKFWKMLFHSLLEVVEIQTGLFGWMESTQILLCCFHAHLIHIHVEQRMEVTKSMMGDHDLNSHIIKALTDFQC